LDMSAARTGVSAVATSNEMMKAPARDDVLMMFLPCFAGVNAWHSRAGYVVDDAGYRDLRHVPVAALRQNYTDC
jgi:hypothetical protein